MPKPLPVWLTTNCGKFLKRWEYQISLPASWETCMQVKKQQLQLDIEQQTGSKLGKECIKTVYCHPPYLTYTQSSVQSLVVSDSWRPHGLQHTRPPCPSPTPRPCLKACPSSWWCHPTISSSVVCFSTCFQSFPASGSFPMSQFFTSGGQSIGASSSVSVLPMNIQDWFPLGLTAWISLQS